MSSADGIDSVYLDGKGEEKYRVMSKTPDDVQQHANINWKSFRRWYNVVYKPTGARTSEQVKKDMDRILIRHDGHHPVARSELCNETMAILDAWAAVPLVPGTKDYKFARVRMLRDLLHERLTKSVEFNRPKGPGPRSLLRQVLPADPTLAALNLTESDISVAYLWIYKTADSGFAKHQAVRQPYSYPVLARDGVNTLHPSFSEDNQHLHGRFYIPPLQSLRASVSPLPVNKSIDPNGRFHPYARPRPIEHPPLALFDEDPSFPLHDQDPSFPPLNENRPSPSPMTYNTVSKTSASNEVTLDELIEEAKNNSAIMGYTEAMNRGLLRHKGRSRVQWVPDSPATTERQQVAEDAKTHGRQVQVLEAVSNGSLTSERDPVVEDAMSQ
ncbi:MAG: hypothetical protein Q9192_008930, partial [Flavoplaca navasiana]